MEQQKFYAKDIAYLEISSGVYTEVEVLDIVRAYGKIRYLIKPVKGKGELKVEVLHKINNETKRRPREAKSSV